MKINCPAQKLKLFGELKEGDIFRSPTSSSLYCMKIRSFDNSQNNTVILNFGTIMNLPSDTKIITGDYELKTYF